jgi:hypothetical protein
MPRTRIDLDDKDFQKLIKKLAEEGTNFKKPLNKFRAYMAHQVDTMWDVLSSGGGTHRGVRWKPFAPQYTRKSGTTVPHYGGIPKVRGKGRVKGRLRPSGRRLTAASQLMQDTGTLRSRATATVFQSTRTRLSFGTSPSLTYAEQQAQARPFLFFYKRKDTPALLKMLNEHLDNITRGKR